MTRLGISFEDVTEAAENILAQGENPTIEKIRRELGTGSNSTIAKYLNEWRANRLIATTDTLPAPNLPPDSVHAAVNQVWEKLRDESETKIKTIQEQVKNEVEIVRIECNQAIAEREQLQQEFDNSQKRLNQISADKEILILDIKALQQEHLLLQEKYKNLESEFSLFKQESNNQITLLQSIYEKETTTKNSIIESIHESHKTSINKLAATHENQRQQHLVEIDSIKVEKQQLNKSIEKQSTENKKLNQELDALKAINNMISKNMESIKQESDKKDKIIEHNHSIIQKIQLIQHGIEKLNLDERSNEILLKIEKFDKRFDSFNEQLLLILNHFIKEKESVEQN